MAKQYIKIRGANEHNLKNIDLDIPRNELVVLTGLSGSGKSSLAFDTIYAEGQRRYMESKSAFYSWNGDGDLRLFSSALCKNRDSTLSEMWEGDKKTDGGSDGGPDYGGAGGNEDPASCTGCERTKRQT